MKKLTQYLFREMKNNFSNSDYGLLKTYGAIPGLILGAYFPEFVFKYLSILIIIFTLLFMRYIYLLFFKSNIIDN